MIECICLKSHYKVPDGILSFLIRNRRLLNRDLVYFKKGTIHYIKEDISLIYSSYVSNNYSSCIIVDGIFKYKASGINNQFQKYFSDAKYIRKCKLDKLSNRND